MLTQIKTSFHPHSKEKVARPTLAVNPELQAHLRVHHPAQNSFRLFRCRGSEQSVHAATQRLQLKDSSQCKQSKSCSLSKDILSYPTKSSYLLYKERQKEVRQRQKQRAHHPNSYMAFQKQAAVDKKSTPSGPMRKYSSLTINDSLHHNLEALPHYPPHKQPSQSFIRTTEGRRVAVDNLALLSRLRGKETSTSTIQRKILEPSLVTVTHNSNHLHSRPERTQLTGKTRKNRASGYRERRHARVNEFRPWSGVKGEVTLLLEELVFE